MASFDDAIEHIKKGNRATRPSWGSSFLVASGLGLQEMSKFNGNSMELYQPTYSDAVATDWVLL